MLAIAICLQLLARRFDDDGWMDFFFVRVQEMHSHKMNSDDFCHSFGNSTEMYE